MIPFPDFSPFLVSIDVGGHTYGIRWYALAYIVGLLGLGLGRVANFINAELWGRPTDAPWGVIFPGAAAQNCPGVEGLCARHPSQLYEAGLEGVCWR
jgi:prolipoprotein diacylglyceryltransferase